MKIVKERIRELVVENSAQELIAMVQKRRSFSQPKENEPYDSNYKEKY
jgi:hypothetical protein